jgi:hypothetical protein
VPLRYVPRSLSSKDKRKIASELRRSRKMYTQKKYYTRKPVKSFQRQTSKHIVKARKLYDVDHIWPNRELATKTGCSIQSLKKIVNKGAGAYFSSGSRPNQTAQSWGIARLASAISGGKASAVDFNILQNGCAKDSKALRLAKQSVHFKSRGHRRVPHTRI